VQWCIDNQQHEQNKKSANIFMSFYTNTLEVVKKTIDILEEEFRKQDILQKDDEMNGQQSPT